MSKAKKVLDRWGLREGEAAELTGTLGRIAEDTLALFIAEDRRRDAADAAAEQKRKLEIFRAERDAGYALAKAARTVLRGVIKRVGAVPVGDRPALERWVPQMAAVVVTALASEQEVEALCAELAAALERNGWDADVTAKVSGFVTQQARVRAAA